MGLLFPRGKASATNCKDLEGRHYLQQDKGFFFFLRDNFSTTHNYGMRSKNLSLFCSAEDSSSLQYASTGADQMELSSPLIS